MKRHISQRDSEQHTRELEEEVYRIRRLLLSKLAGPLRDVLESHRDCEDRDAVYAWRDEAVQKLLMLADRRPSAEMGEYMGTGERAYCPLCGDGSRGPYAAEGFSWPEGLRRHLAGYYNSHECDVMRTFRKKAIEDAESEFMRHLRSVSKERASKRKG